MQMLPLMVALIPHVLSYGLFSYNHSSQQAVNPQ